MIHLPLYLLVQPHVAGRRVLDLLAGHDADGAQLLRRAGAEVVVWEPEEQRRAALPPELEIVDGPPLSVPDASIDVALCIELVERLSVDEREVWLRELARVVRPEGFALVAVRNPERPILRSSGVDGVAGMPYEQLTQLAARHFPRVAVLAQSPMTGFYLSYLQPQREATDLCLNTDLVVEPEEASHFVALLAREVLPDLPAYHLVTLPYYRLLAGVVEAQERLQRESRSLRAEIGQLGGQVLQRETEMLRLAGRTARLERLEDELQRARQAEEALAAARVELQQLAAEVGRQREVAAAWMKELQDARRAGEDLGRRAEQAEHAATELALQRDSVTRRHEGLAQGQRELAVEFGRLKELLRAAQVEAEARRQEAAGLSARLETSGREAAGLRDEGAQARERQSLQQQERDRLRETVLALEERERQDRATCQRLEGLNVELEGRVVQLEADVGRAQLEALELSGRLGELMALREALATAEQQQLVQRAEREVLARGLEEWRRRVGEQELALADLSGRADGRQREMQELRQSRDALQSELHLRELGMAHLEQEAQQLRREETRLTEALQRAETRSHALSGERVERERVVALLEETARGREHQLQLRATQVQELEARGEALVAALEEAQGELEESRRLEGAAQQRLAALHGELEESRRLEGEAQQRLAALHGELEESRRLEGEAQQRLAALHGELEESRRQHVEVKRQVGVLRIELAEGREAHGLVEQQLAALRGVLVRRQEELSARIAQLQEEESRGEALHAALSEAQHRAAGLEDDLAKAQHEQRGLTAELDEARRAVQQHSTALGSELSEAQRRRRDAEQRADALQDELKELRGAIGAAVQRAGALEAHLAAAEGATAEAQQRIGRLEADGTRREEELRSRADRLEQGEARSVALLSDIEESQQQIANLEGELAATRDAERTACARVAELRDRLTSATQAREGEASRQRALELEAERAEAELLAAADEKARLMSLLEERASQEDALQVQLTEQYEVVRLRQKELDQVTGRLREATDQLDSTRRTLNETQQEHRRESEALRHELDHLTGEWREVSRQLAEIQSDHERLISELRAELAAVSTERTETRRQLMEVQETSALQVAAQAAAGAEARRQLVAAQREHEQQVEVLRDEVYREHSIAEQRFLELAEARRSVAEAEAFIDEREARHRQELQVATDVAPQLAELRRQLQAAEHAGADAQRQLARERVEDERRLKESELSRLRAQERAARADKLRRQAEEELKRALAGSSTADALTEIGEWQQDAPTRPSIVVADLIPPRPPDAPPPALTGPRGAQTAPLPAQPTPSRPMQPGAPPLPPAQPVQPAPPPSTQQPPAGPISAAKTAPFPVVTSVRLSEEKLSDEDHLEEAARLIDALVEEGDTET